MTGALDFAATASWRRWTPWTWVAFALAALALVALLLQARPAWQSAKQRDALAAQLARVNAQRQARPPAAPPLPAALEADALASAQELAMPWGPLLGHLARQGDDSLALTQLEPDARSGSLLVSGQAASPQAALAYARRLGQGGTLTQVQLLAHEPVPVPQRLGTQFRLSARWTTGGPVVDEALASAAQQPATVPPVSPTAAVTPATAPTAAVASTASQPAAVPSTALQPAAVPSAVAASVPMVVAAVPAARPASEVRR